MSVLRVNVVLNLQQIHGHGLECELVEERRDCVAPPVQNQQLALGLLRALPHRRLVRLVRVQLLLNHLREFRVALVIPANWNGKLKYLNICQRRHFPSKKIDKIRKS